MVGAVILFRFIETGQSETFLSEEGGLFAKEGGGDHLARWAPIA